ncbi:MAG: antitoxin [Candidatus Binatia bacterium]|nr:MAG: antitoxin [Candidatus Binatia bacterium]
MATVIQIRNVPEELHRRLKMRAAAEGISVSEYVLREIRKSLDRPSREEWLRRIAQLPRTKIRPSAAAVIRSERRRR